MKREVTVVVFGQDCSPSFGLCTADDLVAIGETFLAAAEHMTAGRIGRVEIMDQDDELLIVQVGIDDPDQPFDDDEGLPLLPAKSTPQPTELHP